MKKMKLAVTATTIAMAGSLLTGVAPSTTEPAESARGDRVYMVGDSMTARSKGQIRKRTNGWHIDAVRGRNARRGVQRLRLHKFRSRAGVADTVVIALGSNDRGFRKHHLRHMVDMMPKSTNVVLVTVFRERPQWSRWRQRRMSGISRWMRQLGNRRDNVCVAPWAYYANNNNRVLSRDGVHPTNFGEKVFAKNVVRTVNRCG